MLIKLGFVDLGRVQPGIEERLADLEVDWYVAGDGGVDAADSACANRGGSCEVGDEVGGT